MFDNGDLSLKSSTSPHTFKKINSIIIFLLLISNSTFALDQHGNFESSQEQDLYLIAILKNMATQMNQQMPIPMDEHSKMLNAVAYGKTMSFNVEISSLDTSKIDKDLMHRSLKRKINNIACDSAAVRRLISWGIDYVYLFRDADGRVITRVTLDSSYQC